MIKEYIRDIKKYKVKYILVLPVLIYLFLFSYRSMYGVVVAFQDYRPRLGIADSEWVGFENFIRFFKDPYFFRILGNTLRISFTNLLFSFPMPIILALMLNEVKDGIFKRTIQTLSYLPHFIALVIICGMVTQFTLTNGLITNICVFFGMERQNMLLNQDFFIPIYITSGIWSGIGWGSIIYLAALSSIDQEQYEAARVDGASRLQQIWHITLPGLLPIISMRLILRMGDILSVGREKILLLYNANTQEVADVISTYNYRKGLLEADFSYSTAVGLFDTVINLLFLLTANKLAKKMGQSGLF